MPRKDYEKLAELWPRYADERYFLSKSNKDFVDRNLFITIRDKETTCIQPYQQDLDLPHGLALDVLPLDYYPKNPAERKNRFVWALIYSLFCAQTVPEKALCTYEMGKPYFYWGDSQISPVIIFGKKLKKK